MKRRSLNENAENLTELFDSSYKQTSRRLSDNSINLTLTARIKVQTLEIYWAVLVCLICRNMLKVLKEILKQNTKSFTLQLGQGHTIRFYVNINHISLGKQSVTNKYAPINTQNIGDLLERISS
jgi:hypothetical protein